MFQDRRTKLLRPFDRTRFGFILTEEEKRNAAAEHEGVSDSTKETFNKIFHIFICIHGVNMIKASSINTKVTSELFFKKKFSASVTADILIWSSAPLQASKS